MVDLPVAVPPEAYEAAREAVAEFKPHDYREHEMNDDESVVLLGNSDEVAAAAVNAAAPILLATGVAEGRRLERADHAPEHKAEIVAVVRELVALASDPDGPTAEWINLVKSVAKGHYTPPDERAAHE